MQHALYSVDDGQTRELKAVAHADAVAADQAVAKAMRSEDLALIVHQKLRIAKLERQVYGPKSERLARLTVQIELQLKEVQANAAEDHILAELAAVRTTMVAWFVKRPAGRNTFPERLPRERLVIEAPTACDCGGGTRLRKLGEDVTQTLEVILEGDQDGAGEVRLPRP